MINYYVTLTKGSQFMTTYFSTGLGWIETISGRPATSVKFDKKNRRFLKRGPTGWLYDTNCDSLFSRYRIRKPTLADIIDSLAVDAQTTENVKTFEEWARELGYDTDSRKAEAIYNRVCYLAVAFQNLLGNEAYYSLLNETERL